MTAFTGTGNIRQSNQNSNINTYGLNIMQIVKTPALSNFYFFLILGSGTQRNRIYSFNKRHGLPATI